MGVATLLCIGIILVTGTVNSVPFAKKVGSINLKNFSCWKLFSKHFPQDYLLELVKRPFCNSFTGCGRKRSEPSISEFSDFPSEAEILGTNIGSNEWNQRYQVCNCTWAVDQKGIVGQKI